MDKVAVIVPCAGQGTRLGGKVAKQFLLVYDKPILAYTLDCLEQHPRVDQIILVIPMDWQDQIQALIKTYKYLKITNVVIGDKTRQESVAKGLATLKGWLGPVLIHDGVRPLLSAAVIDRVIDSVDEYGSGVAAIPVTDTVKRVDEQGWVEQTIPRLNLWRIQTPQGFKYADLQKAYEFAKRQNLSSTDDAGLMEAMGQKVRLVPGDVWNIKITYSEDLSLMKARLNQLKT